MKDSELRRLVAEVTREMVAKSTTNSARSSASDAAAAKPGTSRAPGARAVVTTTGKNQRGIVAKIAQAIADAGGDIVDISQTLVSDYFTMIIIVDTAELAVSFAEFKSRLEATVRTAGAECLVMHEGVVNALQRV